MSRRTYSSTALMTLVACRRFLAVATSCAPSRISEVRIVTYSRSEDFPVSACSESIWPIHWHPPARVSELKLGGASPVRNSSASSRRCQQPSRYAFAPAENSASGSVTPARCACAMALPDASSWASLYSCHRARNSSLLPPKWWYKLPTLEPARSTMSLMLALVKPCSVKTSRAASSSARCVSAVRLHCQPPALALPRGSRSCRSASANPDPPFSPRVIEPNSRSLSSCATGRFHSPAAGVHEAEANPGPEQRAGPPASGFRPPGDQEQLRKAGQPSAAVRRGSSAGPVAADLAAGPGSPAWPGSAASCSAAT